MNSLLVKRYVAAFWISFALLFGSGIITPHLGLDVIPTTHACGATENGGGGCA